MSKSPSAIRQILITMLENIEPFEEVVVVGDGTQKIKDITRASSTVVVDDFNNGRINSPEQLIRGKVAGEELLQNDGEPGAAFTVRIHGTSTIRAENEPLYVIHGNPVEISVPSPQSNRPIRSNREIP